MTGDPNFDPKVTDGEIGFLAERIARTLQYVLVSPNEPDRNLEPSNVVDGLFAIARSLHHVARAIERSAGLSEKEPGK